MPANGASMSCMAQKIKDIAIAVADTITLQDSVAVAKTSKGGKARMEKMSPEERTALARSAARERWRKLKERDPGGGDASTPAEYAPIVLDNTKVPVAKWPGTLRISDVEIPCYVLDDERRVITRNAATAVLTDGKGGGNLESYLIVEGLRNFLPNAFTDQMIDIYVPGVSQSPQTRTMGISAETFIEICRAYVAAYDANALKTDRQKVIALKAAMFLAACAKVGLIAMIDEATGYQYARASDALQIKLKLFLAEEMRKWEKTFPDQLWEQFGRLTNWTGSIHSRPKYWGNLVMELIYEYLDADVAQWLRENAPKPMKGQNYHQWMSQQYGLKKLIEHIWKVIGIASTCQSIDELRKQLDRIYGKQAAFHFAVKLVKKSEQTGQELLFDPREETLK